MAISITLFNTAVFAGISVSYINVEYESLREGHLIIGKEIENKNITDIVSIPIDKIKSVTIKGDITKIEEYAFHECTGLKEITVSKNAKVADSTYDKNTVVHRI